VSKNQQNKTRGMEEKLGWGVKTGGAEESVFAKEKEPGHSLRTAELGKKGGSAGGGQKRGIS